eukprot:GHVN01066747.1.p1 GENE.GHVN01066747.1~~GHVN01066747.1.p1  ORF type:complete len:484 (+),score=48.92 GHVN01066747.1:2075-3526(+)
MSRIVGRGTWGEVFIVEETATGAIRAAKKIPKCYVEDVERFSNEIDIMKWMDHPNIVRLHETFEDAHDFYLVEEYCQGGELLDRLMEEGSFTELSASKIMKQILLAVSYCHSQGVAHRDLKPENFLFLNETPDSPLKLIDFGLARRFAHSRAMQTKAGTPYYVAPQVLLGNYGPECDVWSAGVIMYILLCGYPPFNAPSDRSIMEKVKSGMFQFPDAEWQHVSQEAKDLICNLLKLHPKQRITAEQAVKQPWFRVYQPDSPYSRPLVIDILTKFRQFQQLSRLKKIALTVIAQNLEESELEGLRRSFIQVDQNGDGILTSDEIRECVNRSDMKLPTDFVESILSEVDSNGSGSIGYTHFIAVCLAQRMNLQEDACRSAFRVFDIDGNGRISQTELKQIMIMAGWPSNADFTSDLLEADLNGDGEIDFQEFVTFMKRVPSRALLGGDGEGTVSMMKKVSSRTNIASTGNMKTSNPALGNTSPRQ